MPIVPDAEPQSEATALDLERPAASPVSNGRSDWSATPAYPTGESVVDPQQLPGGRASRFGETLRMAPATHVLLAVNIGVFLLMVASGVDSSMPSSAALLHFGANNAALVLQGEWWRIISAMFVHVGVLHLATNMWCLWNLGLLGEPLLGAFGVVCVYVLTGAAGNLLSVAYNVAFQSYGEVGAGASGAVFGLAGMLIVLLSNRRLAEPRNGHPGIPVSELHRLRKSVVWFAAINLCIGLASIFSPYLSLFGIHLPEIRIDNMAHLGGVVSGLAMGVPLLSRMTSGRARYLGRQRVTFALSALVLVLFGVWISKLHG